MTTAATHAVSAQLLRSASTPIGVPDEVVLVSSYSLNSGDAGDVQGGVDGTIVGTWTSFLTRSLQSGATGQTSFFKTGGTAAVTLPASQAAHNLGELSLSFYYQPYASDNKHILFACGDGSQAGDFSIERQTDGKLRGWHVDGAGSLRFFEGSSGITGTNLIAHIAYRITLTLGPTGARLYLDDDLVSTIALNTNGWNNARVKYMGIWTDGVLSPAQGVFSHLRIWDGELEASGVAALDAAVEATIGINDTATVTESTSGNLLGVLANDKNLPTSRTITITQAPVSGTAIVVNNGTASADISYNAAAGASGQTIKYTAHGNEVTVGITVEAAASSAALPAAPSTNAYWVDPISGSDSNTAAQARSASTSPPASNGWKTLAKAISEWNAGNLSASGSGDVEIILRGGLSYERGNNLDITRTATTGSHLVIKGYRSDIQTATRGGTGKYTGAKGRFVLRGNIQALEAAGWEDDPARARNIYRSTNTYTITGKAYANWLRDGTYNLQLVPARNIGDLDTDTTSGTGAAVYTAPSVVADSSRFYVRMDTNEWTDYWNPDFLSPAASWVTNPSTETLAVYDETAGVRFSGTIAFVDFSFFNIEYWWRPINTTGASTQVNDFTMDYVTIKASFNAIRFRECAQVNRLSITHCDFMMGIPPWAARQWIHGEPHQAAWDSFFVFIQAETASDTVLIEHCRFVRTTDAYTQPDASSIVSNLIFRHNHVLNARDDVLALNVSAYNVEVTYNYFQDGYLGFGGYAGSTAPANQAGWKVGFNIFDMRKYTNVIGFNYTGATRFAPGTSNKDGGAGCGRLDPMHGAPSVWHERHWYHNTCLVAQDRNQSNGSTNAFGYKTETASIDANNPSTHYNNIIIQVERTSVLGGVRSNTLERDYNCNWVDEAGLLWSSTRAIPRRTDGAAIAYASWAAWLASGTHYDQTKHANGPGPGSAAGWDANGVYADPQFVNGSWETIVRGDLTTYFPQVNGNLKFAVNLNTGATASWPGIDGTYEYVGAYQPGDSVTKIGPEQGLWED